MTKTRPFTIGVLLVLMVVPVMQGCVKEIRETMGMPEREKGRFDIVAPAEIDRQILRLNDAVAAGTLSEEEEKVADLLLSDYMALKSLCRTGVTDRTAADMLRRLVAVLGRMTDMYFSAGGDAGTALSKSAVNQYILMTRTITNDFLAADYEGVISTCRYFEEIFGPGALPVDIRAMKAVSLGKTGMEQEALAVAGDAVKEMEEAPDLARLRAAMARWWLNAGDRDEARRVYEKMVGDYEATAAAREEIKSALAAAEKNARKPSSSITATGVEKSGDETPEPGSLAAVLSEVDGMIAAHRFEDAKLLLIREKIRHGSSDTETTIDAAMERVEAAEAAFQQRKEKGVRDEDVLAAAAQLMDEERYGEAIEKLAVIGDDSAVALEAREIKKNAIEKLIHQKRTEAARSFLEAKKTDDPAKRKELLLLSRDILETLIDRYPESLMIPTLKRNLATIKEELR